MDNFSNELLQLLEDVVSGRISSPDGIVCAEIGKEGKIKLIDDYSKINHLENSPDAITQSRARFTTQEEFDKHWNALRFHIDAIEAEDDVDVIETHIEALQILEPFYNVRRDIRHGLGLLEKIQQKCINLNLV